MQVRSLHSLVEIRKMNKFLEGNPQHCGIPTKAEIIQQLNAANQPEKSTAQIAWARLKKFVKDYLGFYDLPHEL